MLKTEIIDDGDDVVRQSVLSAVVLSVFFII